MPPLCSYLPETKLICKCTDVVSNKEYTVDTEENKVFYAEIKYVCKAAETAQIPIKVSVNGKIAVVYVCLAKADACTENFSARIAVDDSEKPITVSLNYGTEIEIKEMECYI